MVHTHSQATIRGEPLPDSAIEKVSVALSSTSKMVMSMSKTITSMRGHLSHPMVKSGYDKLTKQLAKLKSFSSNLDNVKLMGTFDDGSSATCKTVLEMLGELAAVMEESLTDMQANAGLIAGLKRGGK